MTRTTRQLAFQKVVSNDLIHISPIAGLTKKTCMEGIQRLRLFKLPFENATCLAVLFISPLLRTCMQIRNSGFPHTMCTHTRSVTHNLEASTQKQAFSGDMADPCIPVCIGFLYYVQHLATLCFFFFFLLQ